MWAHSRLRWVLLTCRYLEGRSLWYADGPLVINSSDDQVIQGHVESICISDTGKCFSAASTQHALAMRRTDPLGRPQHGV
jgi:hypothetical protein